MTEEEICGNCKHFSLGRCWERCLDVWYDSKACIDYDETTWKD